MYAQFSCHSASLAELPGVFPQGGLPGPFFFLRAWGNPPWFTDPWLQFLRPLRGHFLAATLAWSIEWSRADVSRPRANLWTRASQKAIFVGIDVGGEKRGALCANAARRFAAGRAQFAGGGDELDGLGPIYW